MQGNLQKPKQHKRTHPISEFATDNDDNDSISQFITQKTLPPTTTEPVTTPTKPLPKISKKTTKKTEQHIDLIQQFINTGYTEPPTESKPDTEKIKRKYTYLTNKIVRHAQQKKFLDQNLANNTIPTGLQCNIKCSLPLPTDIQTKWEITRTTNERLPLKEQLTLEETHHIDTKIISEITNKREKEHTYTGPPTKRHREDNNNNF